MNRSRRGRGTSTQKIAVRLFGILLGGVLALSATGCDRYIFMSEMSISIDVRGQILVGVCADTEADEIFAEYQPQPGPEPYRVFEAKGKPVNLRKGRSWVLQSDALGFLASTNKEFELVGGSELYIVLTGVGESRSLRSLFTVPEDGLSSEEWLFPDGSLSGSVCGAYDR